MGRFDGSVALVTGASRGIGLGIAQRLVDEGARVCVTARTPGGARRGGRRSSADPSTRSPSPARPTTSSTSATPWRRIVETFGSLDLLVNNTGINPVYGPLVELDLGAARKIVEVNCIAALAWVQQAHAAWMGEHGGAVVNVASVAGLKPAPGIGFYGASKAMLIHLTEELAVELGPTIRVNAVAPAVVKTAFATALYEGREEQVVRDLPAQAPRRARPTSAGAVAYLLSDGRLLGHRPDPRPRRRRHHDGRRLRCTRRARRAVVTGAGRRHRPGDRHPARGRGAPAGASPTSTRAVEEVATGLGGRRRRRRRASEAGVTAPRRAAVDELGRGRRLLRERRHRRRPGPRQPRTPTGPPPSRST